MTAENEREPDGTRAGTPPEDARPLLELEGVAHAFGGVQAVNGVTFSVFPGEFVGLIGPNGAGKTTLVDCVSGVVAPQAGRVRFNCQDITGRTMHDVAQLGLIRTFQASRVFGRLTVMSNVMAGAPGQLGERLRGALLGGWRDQERELETAGWELLNHFGLTEVADNYGTELSGGQRRLAELCRTLMARPRMLLLDEPFAGVSPTNRALLAEQLRALTLERGTPVLMIEHRLELVEQLCQRVVVMAEGKVIAQGSMADLRQDQAVVSAYLGDVVIDAA